MLVAVRALCSLNYAATELLLGTNHEVRRKTELTMRALGVIDRVFLVLFGRFRRKFGDTKIEAAWHSASFRVSGHLALFAAATVFVLFEVTQWFTGSGLAPKQERAWQIVVGVVAVSITVLLDRRFKKYLSVPPTLAAEESSAEKSLIRWFRATTIGTFAFVCLAAILMHDAGF